jgi:hypothetical protein
MNIFHAVESNHFIILFIAMGKRFKQGHPAGQHQKDDDVFLNHINIFNLLKKYHAKYFYIL